MHDVSKRPKFAVLKLGFFWSTLVLVWMVSLVYMYSTLMRGWVPHDEGALAQAAERVLQGQLPHRDFDDIYTGGLALLDAFAFRALGVNLASLRWVFFLFFAAWVPAVYYIASRFASQLVAGAVTLLIVAWSVPNYAAPIPSWYNLFFAVFGAAALLRYLEYPGAGLLILAGICGGLSCLAKIVGAYYLAAVLLFFVFREQSVMRDTSAEAVTRHFRLYPIVIATGLLAFFLTVMKTVHWSVDPRLFLHFELPSLVIVVLLLNREASIKQGTDTRRFGVLLRMLWPFLAGVLGPIATFLAPYIMSNSVLAVIHGVFVLPGKRHIYATWAPGGLQPIPIFATLVLLALLYSATRIRDPLPFPWWCRMASLTLLVATIVASGREAAIYQFVWSSVILLIPITVVVGSMVLWLQKIMRGKTPWSFGGRRGPSSKLDDLSQFFCAVTTQTPVYA